MLDVITPNITSTDIFFEMPNFMLVSPAWIPREKPLPKYTATPSPCKAGTISSDTHASFSRRPLARRSETAVVEDSNIIHPNARPDRRAFFDGSVQADVAI